MKHKLLLMGEAGAGKSTAGLSYPGVEMISWGSTEEATIGGFTGRKDILPPVKFQWRDYITEAEHASIAKIMASGDDLTQDKQIAPLHDKARARAVSKLFKYLEQTYHDVKSGKRPDLKTLMLDNFSPLSQDIMVYTTMLHGDEISEKESFKIWDKFYFYCDKVFDLMNAIDTHSIVTCHVAMALDEEVAAKVPFFEQTKVMSKKDWQPFVTGKYKFRIKSKFDYAFFLYNEEELGKPMKYYAELAGLGKGRINPFEGKQKIELPKGTFYDFFNEAINKQGEGPK